MNSSVRIGRVGGVPIGMNWSLLVFGALLAVGLADNRLPHDAPGYSGTAYALVGVATAVALLVGVLAHELGHAWMARRAGNDVEGITLTWMGGLTRIEGEASRPALEFAIAAIGPAISAALGAVLLGARVLAEAAGAGGLVIAALGWLAVIQIALALFNLVPAAPLDGGKVLHSAIWAVTGNRWWASRVTSWIGVGLGGVLAGAGVWLTLTSPDPIGGLVVVLVGGWLLGTARSEERAAAVHRVLDGVPVSAVMRPVAAAPGWITVRAFLETYVAARPGYVWLLERWGGPGYEGVLSGEALAAVPMPHWNVVRPQDVAVPIADLVGVTPGEDALTAVARTGGRQVLLVVDGDHTVGAVLPNDLEAIVRSGRRPEPGWRTSPATDVR